jgi:hypothetical protein
MNFSIKEIEEIKKLAASIDVPLAALLAVIEVESAGVKGTMINNVLEPVIRYEGHYFDRLAPANVREAARKAGVSSPTVGGVKNPSSQKARYELLIKAASFDSKAAYQSVSWGVGQVMGANWKDLGFFSIEAFVKEVRKSFVGQISVMVKFIKVNKLDAALRRLDWSAFARGYNGPAYRQNQYDTKMAKAYIKHGGTKSIPTAASGYLRLGSKGPGVREIQGLLVIAGHELKIDGDFGPSTDRVIKEFQTKNKLNPDGIVGPKTQEALNKYRVTASETVGQERITDIKEVKEGVGTSVVVPTTVVVIKEELEKVVDQLSPFSMFENIIGYIQFGLSVIAIGSLVFGIGYAIYGWRKSKKSFTGTKNTDLDSFRIENDVEDDGQIVLPNLG